MASFSEIVQELRQTRRNLDRIPFGAATFPAELGRVLDNRNSTDLQIFLATLQATPLQRRAFTGLDQIRSSATGRAWKAMYKQGLLNGEQGEMNFDAILNRSLPSFYNPDLIADALSIRNKANMRDVSEAQTCLTTLKAHHHLSDVVDALRELEKTALLQGVKAQDNYLAIITHPDPKGLAAALKEVNTGSAIYDRLLQGDAAQANFDAVIAHSDPEGFARLLQADREPAYHHLEMMMRTPLGSAGNLTADILVRSYIACTDLARFIPSTLIHYARTGSSQAAFEALLATPIRCTRTVLEAINELQTTPLLSGEFGQANRDALISAMSQIRTNRHYAIISALRQLKSCGLLNGDAARANFMAMITNPYSPSGTAYALIKLNKAGLLSGDGAQANRDAISRSPYPEVIASILKKLNQAGLLSGDEAQVTPEIVSHYHLQLPSYLNAALHELQIAGLLTQANFIAIRRHSNLTPIIRGLRELNNPRTTAIDRHVNSVTDEILSFGPRNRIIDELVRAEGQIIHAPFRLGAMAIDRWNSGSAVAQEAFDALLLATPPLEPTINIGAVNISAVAEDTESSMKALSADELKRFAVLKERYKPMIDAKGQVVMFEEFKTQLAERYRNNPAHIVVNGEKIKLPLTWEEFTDPNGLAKNDGSKIILSEKQRERALTQYYQNKAHTALRYVSKPNSWISASPSYTHGEPYSTFEDYISDINILWAAATDSTIEPVDGFTLESRADQFIDELAHIGRAHNWDHKRDMNTYELHLVPLAQAIQEGHTNAYVLDGDTLSYINHKGIVKPIKINDKSEFNDTLAQIRGDNSTTKLRLTTDLVAELITLNTRHKPEANKTTSKAKIEGYDDLKGDDPSCYSGVNKRIHQGLMGYPIAGELSLEGVLQELNAFVYRHFKEKITDENQEAISNAWQEYIIELEVNPVIKALDIPEEKQQEFIQYLRTTYNPQFDANESFLKEINKRFALKPENDAHLLSFAGEANLESLIPQPKAATEHSAEILHEKAVKIQAAFKGYIARVKNSGLKPENLSDTASESNSETQSESNSETSSKKNTQL